MDRRNEIGQLKPVACTAPECQMRFDTIKDMKNHKISDVDHFYCKKCNVDCDSFTDLTLHKVQAMQPWLEGRRSAPEGQSPKHIVCEFCGADFKTFSGRKLHRERYHQADQCIACPGCQTIFARGAEMVAHLESEKCSAITKQQYYSHVQQTYVRKEVVQGADTITQNLEENKESREHFELQLLLGSDTQDTEDGGIDLLSQVDQGQELGMEPLQAQLSALELSDSRRRRGPNEDSWPFLPGQGPKQQNVFTGRDGDKVRPETFRSLQSQAVESRATSSEVTANATPATNHRPAWATGSTSQALFPNAKPTAQPGNWGAILQQRREETAVQDSHDLRKARFWDPTSRDYDVNLFYNYLIGRYSCPFEGCGDAVYKEPVDLEGHIKNTHLRHDWACPICGKRFKSGSALLAHAEAGGRCQVKHSSKYKQLLDEVSGGFLAGQSLREPNIASGKDVELGGGLMSTKIVAKMPDEK